MPLDVPSAATETEVLSAELKTRSAPALRVGVGGGAADGGGDGGDGGIGGAADRWLQWPLYGELPLSP